MKIKKIMFVTKFEKLGYTALQSLLDLRNASLEHIVFVHVIERERVAFKRGVGYKKDEERRLRETANIRFIDWAEHLFELGMEVGVYIVVGSMVPQAIKAAEKENADMIVIGRPQTGRLEQLYAGSDVTELIRRAAVPVMVFKHMSESSIVPERPFARPLLATDWSPACLRAVDYLVEMKSIIGEIDVVHVASEKELTGASNLEIQRTRKAKRQKLEAICDRFEAAGIAARAHIYVGDPTSEIEKAARERQSTIIVLGSSGKTAWVERWVGSLPREVAENSAFPTLLIPPARA